MARFRATVCGFVLQSRRRPRRKDPLPSLRTACATRLLLGPLNQGRVDGSTGRGHIEVATLGRDESCQEPGQAGVIDRVRLAEQPRGKGRYPPGQVLLEKAPLGIVANVGPLPTLRVP